MSSLDISKMAPEQRQRFMGLLDTILANCRPVTEDDLRDLAEAKRRWEAGHRGKGIAARLAEWGKEE